MSYHCSSDKDMCIHNRMSLENSDRERKGVSRHLWQKTNTTCAEEVFLQFQVKSNTDHLHSRAKYDIFRPNMPSNPPKVLRDLLNLLQINVELHTTAYAVYYFQSIASNIGCVMHIQVSIHPV